MAFSSFSFHCLQDQRRQLQHEPHAQGAEDHDRERQVRGRGERLREDEAAEGVDGAADVDDGVAARRRRSRYSVCCC